MDKNKIIVCGTRFGKMYIESILEMETEFELMGIFSKGSSSSKKYAQLKELPLYTEKNLIPDVDMACIILKFISSGGNGNDIVENFINKGTSILVEQPIHYYEYLKMIKLAMKNGVYLEVSNFYRYIEATNEYVEFVNSFSKIEEIKYINIECGYQLLHPTISILGDLINIEDYSINSKVIRVGSFDIISFKIGDINCKLQIHNEVDDEDTDNYFYLFYNFKVGFNSGDIVLTDPSGPIYWYSRFYLENNYVYGDNENEHMKKKNNIVIGEGNRYSDILWEEWKKAISKQLLEFKIKLSNKKQWERLMQIELTHSALIKDIIEIIGYPRTSKFNILNRELEIKNIIFQNKLKRNNIESILNELNGELLDEKLNIMNKACSLSILLFLKNINIVGHYECIDLKKIPKRYKTYEYIIYRWIKILKDKNYLIEKENKLYLDIKYKCRDLNDEWNKVEEQWVGSLTDIDMIRYYRSHATNLEKIFDGKLNPTYVLFPEGKMERADNFYNNSLIGKYLNNNIVKYIENITNENTKILEIGAGTGATTDNILKNINSYKEYIFTDISQYFIKKAEERFSSFENIKYKILDMNKDFCIQGINKESIDIVVIAGAINNAINTNITLSYIREIIKKGGLLIIAEPIEDILELQISQLFIMDKPKDSRWNDNITFYKEKDWLVLLSKSGFKILDVYPKKYELLSKMNQKLFISRKE